MSTTTLHSLMRARRARPGRQHAAATARQAPRLSCRSAVASMPRPSGTTGGSRRTGRRCGCCATPSGAGYCGQACASPTPPAATPASPMPRWALALGYEVTLAMPSNASTERKRMFRRAGAQLILTDASEGIDGSISTIRDLVAREPERYFYPRPAPLTRPTCWRTTTLPARRSRSNRRPGHALCGGAGHQRHLYGHRYCLRDEQPDVALVAVQPDGPYHALEGVKHMATTVFVPGSTTCAARRSDRLRSEEAFAMVLGLARVKR